MATILVRYRNDDGEACSKEAGKQVGGGPQKDIGMVLADIAKNGVQFALSERESVYIPAHQITSIYVKR